MNVLRTLALGLWMAGLYSVIFCPEWGPLAGRGWLWDPPAMASQPDPVQILVQMALWNVGWLLAAWFFTLAAELCHPKYPVTRV